MRSKKGSCGKCKKSRSQNENWYLNDREQATAPTTATATTAAATAPALAVYIVLKKFFVRTLSQSAITLIANVQYWRMLLAQL